MNLKRAMQFLSIFALMVWGGVFVYFYLTPAADGTGPLIQKYVNANKNFDLWVLIAGMGLFVLAIFNLITFKQKSGICNHEHSHGDACDHDHHHDHSDDDHVHTEACDHGHDHDHDHSDGHDHGEEHNHDHEQTTAGLAFSILILVVPVLVAANYSQGKFSPDYFRKLTQIESKMRAMEIEKNGGIVVQQTTMAEVKAAENAADTPPNPGDEASSDVASFTMEDLKKMVPQNDAGSFMLEVPEIYYTAGDQQLMKVLEGVPVEFTAQVMNETVNNESGNRLRAFRLLVECCAADARPISMPLEFSEKLPEFEEMGWFKMTGKLHYAKENDEWVPMLRVMEFNQTAEQIEMLY